MACLLLVVVTYYLSMTYKLEDLYNKGYYSTMCEWHYYGYPHIYGLLMTYTIYTWMEHIS